MSASECSNLVRTVQNVGDAHGDELVCAHVIYRHGNRSSLSTYKNDPYKDEKCWPDGFGQLNNVSA